MSKSVAPSFLALGCVGALAFASGAHAQDATEGVTLGGVTVTDTAIVDQPARQESPKATRPVRDTPQTITIMTNTVIEQQNLLTLRDVLSTVPGITFGAGEGGGGYGDNITLRGYSANTDITTDGVRDSAQYSRTDSFNIDQIEVTNGANSVTAGAGAVGGSINIVTKRPQADTQIVANAGIGTDNYYRAAIDANVRASDFIAFRINAMAHKNDVPGRDVEDYKRWGVAPSITFGIESPTRLTLQYLHQEDNNVPQYGAPYVAALGGLLPGAHRSDYFGFRNVDTQETNIDQLTATFEHEFSDRVSIRNLTRWQDVTQFTIVNPPQGTYCLASGILPDGSACPDTVPAGYYLPTGPRGTTRDSRNQLMFNQFDLKAVFDTAGIEHTLVVGGALTWEKYDLAHGNSQRNADGSTVTYPLINIANPGAIVPGPDGFTYGSNVYTGSVAFVPQRYDHGEQENYAVYLFDTMKISDHFELSGGVRYEHNKGSFRRDTVEGATPTSGGTVTPGTTFHNKDDLFSYRVGLNYKPVEAISLYLAYGNSRTPSKSSVNGSCTAESCNVKPETAKSYEVGAKAELGEGVLLTAALFRNERSNFLVTGIISDDNPLGEMQLDGKSRVDGIALGANGQITPDWTVTANYTYLDSKIIHSVADGLDDPLAGAALTNVPKHSGSVFTTYTLPFGLKLGYGFTYQGKFDLNSTTSGAIYQVDDYLIHNAMLAYDFMPGLSAQLNVKNFTDKTYFTGVRNGATTSAQWARVGEGRSAILTLGYKF
ncbi:catecholate siderophore receptor [Sphingobium sp. OAS761]|uniref:TonB-dependent receptor n=1 Tax=Sphingobium sp. OAS761 TaxID=2817901 RepID=UPI0020A22453|nr:TonB-dependent siderophore receptor [Sphingobium sp. OAS761]MCP1470572.1 catecholate siderophore receptor [Sphingobium sp. OAS761]